MCQFAIICRPIFNAGTRALGQTHPWHKFPCNVFALPRFVHILPELHVNTGCGTVATSKPGLDFGQFDLER